MTIQPGTFQALPFYPNVMPLPAPPYSQMTPVATFAPSTSNVPPFNNLRPLTMTEFQTFQQAKAQRWRPVNQQGIDVPVLNMVSNPNKNGLLGVLLGGLFVGGLVSLFGRSWSAVLNGVAAGATFFGMTYYRSAQKKNELAANLLQHDITQYDHLPSHVRLQKA